MFSATENIISSWDSYHHHHHHYHHYHDNHQLRDHQQQQQQQLQENPPLKLNLDGKKAIKVSSKTVEEDREVVKILRRKRPTREEAQMVISRVCSDCGTNKTPLWRSGPAGPKSLCNACGIRNRKRRRREFEAIEMMRDISMNENQRHDNEDDEEENERVSLLLQRKFAGKEEAEAALLLMALSCGIYVHS